MARDPFAAEMEASGLAGAPRSTQTSTSTLVMRVVTAASVLALLALVFAYYLPLREAHSTLSDRYRSLSSEHGGTAEQLGKTTEQLLAAQAERDKLVAEKKESEETEAAQAEKVKKLATGLEETLSSFIKNKQATIEQRKDAAYVTFDDDVLFAARDTTPSRSGKRILCAVAKGVEALSVKAAISVEGHTKSSKVADVFLRRDYPTVWQLSAARAAGATLMLDQCGFPGKHLSATGYAEHRPEESDSKSKDGQIRLAVRPRAE